MNLPSDFFCWRRRVSSALLIWLLSPAGLAAPLPELVAPELAGRGKITPVQVRWSDPDRYQHVNNVRYLDYVLAGRVDMTSHADPSMARVAMGNADAARWLIARQDIDYLVQMMFRLEPFHVLTAPVHLGTSSIVLATEIVQGSGNRLLDNRAEAIAQAAGPFGAFGPAMRAKADQIAVVSRFKFTRDQTLETSVQ